MTDTQTVGHQGIVYVGDEVAAFIGRYNDYPPVLETVRSGAEEDAEHGAPVLWSEPAAPDRGGRLIRVPDETVSLADHMELMEEVRELREQVFSITETLRVVGAVAGGLLTAAGRVSVTEAEIAAAEAAAEAGQQ